MKTQTLSLADCYRILGLSQGATLDEVKHAYRKRAFELHPDLNPDDGASRKFQQLNEAYVILIRLLGNSAPSSDSGGEANRRQSRRDGRQAYEEQARRDRERREAEERERKEKREQARQEREEQLRREQDRRRQEEREKLEAERRERLKREIERQEEERLARQAEAKRERERQEQARQAAEKAREEQLRQQEARPESYRRTYTRPQSRATDSGRAAGPAAPTSASSSSSRMEAGAAAGPASSSPDRETLLKELLNDPFARRVYEDIYSEVRNRRNAPAEPPPPRKFQLDWGGRTFSLDLTGGIGKSVRNWLRGQIDEEQELFFPASQLFPGARIRLQIRRGFSGEQRTVDITLPQDFAVGKPVRLKGMGRKVGRWQGDLYLIFQIKE